MRDAVIEVARGELGVTELPPGSNKVLYNTEYYGREVSGPEYKWCLVLLWWIFNHAGEKMAFFGGAKTASCGTFYRWYKAQGLTVPKNEVKAGDIVILNFKGTSETQHCGLVVDAQNNWIQTIEGNTSPGMEGSQDNGGCVALKIRTMSQIVGVCRPKYKEDGPVIDEDDIYGDYSDHWAAPQIRWAINKGLLKGYPDGTFKPDKPVTRAELAVVLNRIYDVLEVKNG